MVENIKAQVAKPMDVFFRQWTCSFASFS